MTAEVTTWDEQTNEYKMTSYSIFIHVTAAEGTEDCESCVDDCGACACIASCEGKTCGDDGCGRSCGVCGLGSTCEDALCVNPGWTTEDAVTIEVSDLAGNLAP